MNYYFLVYNPPLIILLCIVAFLFYRIRQKSSELKKYFKVKSLDTAESAHEDIERLNDHIPDINSTLDEYNTMYNAKVYFTKESYRQWFLKWIHLEQMITKINLNALELRLSDKIKRFSEALSKAKTEYL